MLALLSPAKKLSSDVKPVAWSKAPALGDDISTLLALVKALSAADLMALMHISAKLGALNEERFKHLSWPIQEATPAALTFAGDTYQGLMASEWSEEEFLYADQHVGILSGLYGYLRPSDGIAPYRLEMGTKLKNPRGNNLHAFWRESLTAHINGQLQGHKRKVVVVCASKEYFGAVNKKALDAEVITPVFRERWDGKCRTISFFAKRARGALASAMIQNRWEEPQELQQFSSGGYCFMPEKSTSAEYCFERDKPEPKS